MNTCPLDLLEQDCWLKSLRLIYDTLYTLALAKAAELQLAGWTARPDQTSEKTGKISVCQKNNAGHSATQIFDFFSRRDSFTATKRSCLCFMVTSYPIRRWNRNITRGSLRALTRLVQHLRRSDKVFLYLTLPSPVFLLSFNLRAAPKPLLLF